MTLSTDSKFPFPQRPPWVIGDMTVSDQIIGGLGDLMVVMLDSQLMVAGSTPSNDTSWLFLR